MPLDDKSNFGNEPGFGPLRPGGVIGEIGQKDRNLPSTPSKSAKAQSYDLEIVRDLFAGNTTVHAKSTAYLPKSPGEDPQNYSVRLQRAVFVNYFRNTIDGLTGYIYRMDPKLGEDVPPEITGDEEGLGGHWENIDLAGTHGDVFTRTLTADAMTAGHAAIMVEYPKTGGTQSRAAEAFGEIRPYWIHVFKDNILSWRTTVENGRTILTQIVLKESQMVPDGRYGERKQERYRVLYRQPNESGQPVVGFRLEEVVNNKEVVVVDEGTYPTQDEIPLAEVRTAGSRGLFESDPPFLDLAYLNLGHYRQWSDYDTSIHMTCVPIWWEAGGSPPKTDEKLILGPNTARREANENFKCGYAAHDGAALASAKQSLDDLKTDMAQLGLAALQSSKRVAETATAKELDKSASDSALAVTARGVQDGIERALYFHARYLGLTDGGSIDINRDYGDNVMDSAEMVAWATLAEKLGVPVRLVLEALQRGNKIPEGADLDALEAEMMAEQAAKEAEKERQREDQLRALEQQVM